MEGQGRPVTRECIKLTVRASTVAFKVLSSYGTAVLSNIALLS